jgi:hypothetical protein
VWRRRVLGLVAIARICPDDVRLTLEQAIPGGMSLEDYSLLREVIAAIRGGFARSRPIAASMCWAPCTPVAFGGSGHSARLAFGLDIRCGPARSSQRQRTF